MDFKYIVDEQNKAFQRRIKEGESKMEILQKLKQLEENIKILEELKSTINVDNFKNFITEIEANIS